MLLTQDTFSTLQVEGCKEVVWADQESDKKAAKNQLDIDRLINLPSLSENGISDMKSYSPVVYSTKVSRPPSPHIPNKMLKLDESANTKPSDDDELMSPELLSTSVAVTNGMRNLGIQTTLKTEPRGNLLSANVLFDPPLFNEGAKRCLTKQFGGSTLKANMNETFNQSALNETFNDPVNLNGTYVCGSDPSLAGNPPSRYTKPNVTFADAVKSPVVKKPSTATPKSSGFKNLSRTPLSMQNFSKNGASSAGITKKSGKSCRQAKFTKSSVLTGIFMMTGGGRSLKRHNSVHQLRVEPLNENNNRLRKFSSSSTLPLAAMTRTAMLRNIFNRNGLSSSKLQNKL